MLRHRDLRVLFSASPISQTGSWSYSVALATFAYERTHSLTSSASRAWRASCRRCS